MKRYLSLIFLLLLFCLPSFEEEEEESSYVEPPRVTGAGERQSIGSLTISSPAENSSYESGGKLTVKASGEHLTRMEAVLSWEDGSLSCEA